MEDAMKRIKKISIISAMLIVFLSYFLFYSYNVLNFFKIINKDNKEIIATSASNPGKYENDITKNDRDLLNVDYKTFYDDLKPYGTWIQVNLSDSGGVLSSKPDEKELSEILRTMLGIKEAKADVDVSWGAFYIWKPSPSLAVSIAAGDPGPGMYVPYTNGQWVYSDYGWYFRAATPYEEIVHHYGRWVFVPSEGWMWIPGSVWAPAWVEWEEDDDFIGWAPCEPTVYFEANYFPEPFYRDYNFVVVERNHFLDPNIYNSSHIYWEKEHRNEYRDMQRINGLVYRDKGLFNRGPDVNRFSKDFPDKTKPVNINMVSNKNEVQYKNNKYNVYTPKVSYRNIPQLTKNENNRISLDKNLNSKGKKSERSLTNPNNIVRNSDPNLIKNNNKSQNSNMNSKRENISRNKGNDNNMNRNNNNKSNNYRSNDKNHNRNNNLSKSNRNSYNSNTNKGNSNNRSGNNKQNNINPGNRNIQSPHTQNNNSRVMNKSNNNNNSSKRNK
jgi:hypothetical protein